VGHDETVRNAFFDKMIEHKKANFKIARKDKDNQKLFDWIARQRREERDGTLSPERKERLVEVGFEFRRTKQPCKTTRFTLQQDVISARSMATAMSCTTTKRTRRCQSGCQNSVLTIVKCLLAIHVDNDWTS
jgi:hypothetical protein